MFTYALQKQQSKVQLEKHTHIASIQCLSSYMNPVRFEGIRKTDLNSKVPMEVWIIYIRTNS